MTDPKELAKLFPKRERKPITNYDRLIRKTPEEMAEQLFRNNSCVNRSCAMPFDCAKCWLYWLKSPAEKEGEG